MFWLKEKTTFKSWPHCLKWNDSLIFVFLPLICFATLNPSLPQPPLPTPHCLFIHTHTLAILLCQATFRRLTSKLPKGIPTLLHPQLLPPPFSVFPSLQLPLCEYLRNKWRRCRAPWVLEGWVASQRAVIIPPLRWFKGPGTCWPMHGTESPALHWHLPLSQDTLFIFLSHMKRLHHCNTFYSVQTWTHDFVTSLCLALFKRECSFVIFFTTWFLSPVVFSGYY